MSTQLADKGTHFEVSTVAAPGTRRKIPRGATMVPKGDPELLKAEIVRQAKALRVAFGVEQTEEVPVV